MKKYLNSLILAFLVFLSVVLIGSSVNAAVNHVYTVSYSNHISWSASYKVHVHNKSIVSVSNVHVHAYVGKVRGYSIRHTSKKVSLAITKKYGALISQVSLHSKIAGGRLITYTN